MIENKVFYDIRYSDGITRSTLTDVTVDGVRYTRTGNRGEHGVFMLSDKWPHMPMTTDDGLFVFQDECQMIPLADCKASTAENFAMNR